MGINLQNEIYSVELRPYFFKNFKNFSIFPLNSIIPLFNIIPKSALITGRVSLFFDHLKENCFSIFQIEVNCKNNFFYFRAIIKSDKRRSSDKSHFERIHRKLLFYSPNKFCSLLHQWIDRRSYQRKILNKHSVVDHHPNKSSCLCYVV